MDIPPSLSRNVSLFSEMGALVCLVLNRFTHSRWIFNTLSIAKEEIIFELINLNKNSNKIMYSNPNLNKVKNNKSFFSNNVCTFKDVVVINKMFKRSMLNGVNNIVIKRTSDIIKYKTLKSDIIYNSSTNNKIIGPNYNNLIIFR